VSFLNSNSRPDLLKTAAETERERGSRGSDKYMGETGQPAAPEPPANPFMNEPRSQGGAGPTPPDRCTNVVAAGAHWQGTLKVDDSARIDGIFSGEIQAKGTVHVSDGAEVDAKIHAAFVVISGTFRGEIRCEQRVDLLPKSRVSGEVITKILSIQEGATLDGSVQMTSDGAVQPRYNTRGSRNGVAADSDAASERRRDREAIANGTENTRA
jgi:cytoskeletal protein CcmA (bactofilin family)